MKGKPFLDFVIREGTAVIKLVADDNKGEYEAFLVRGNASRHE
jgi:hypothetical protein